MAKDFSDSKDGVRPGMNADEAGQRLRARDKSLGQPDRADENSAVGWTEDEIGQTFLDLPATGTGAGAAAEHSGPLASEASDAARIPSTAKAAEGLKHEDSETRAPVEDDIHPTPQDIAHDRKPEESPLLHVTGLSEIRPGAASANVAQLSEPGAGKPDSIHGGGEGIAPLQVTGSVNAELIEDSRQAAVGRLVATGGERGVPYHWQVMAPDGVYGQLSVDSSGNWLYALNNDSPLVQALGEGEHVNESFLLRVTAGGVPPQDLRIVVDVQGTNDRPQILQTSWLSGAVQEDLHSNADGWLRASDVDANDQLRWTLGSSHGRYGELSVDAVTGQWHYTLDNGRAPTQALSQGQQASESFLATVTDEHGATSSARITITVAGSNDGPVIGQFHAAQATEDGVTVLGRIPADDVDALDHLRFSTSAQVVGFTLHEDGSYSFDPSDASYQHLAQGAAQQMVVPVTVTDDHGASATRDLTIILTGSNDLPVFTAIAPRNAVEQGPVLHGQLVAADVDAGDVLTFATPVSVAGFVLNGNGSYSFDPGDPAYQSLPDGAQRVLTIALQVTDNHGGTALQNLVINLTGTNQGAIIGGVSSGSVVEDRVVAGTQQLVTGGRLSILDPDAGESAFVSHQGHDVLQGHYGTLDLDTQGRWHYHADNAQQGVQQLGQGQTLTEHFQIASLDGTPHTIDITLVGTNDLPVVGATSVSSGALVEDAQPHTLAGQLQATDADATSQLSWSLLPYSSQYGTLAIDPNTGAWTYTLDNSRAATQALAEGEQVIERFTAQVTDEHGAVARQDVVITLTGSNDNPVLQQVTTQYLTENGVAVHGQLAAHDVDRGDTLTYGSSAPVAGFSLNADGSWSFDPTNLAYQPLPAGATQTISIPLSVSDEHGGTGTQVLTLVITGTNQGALITGVHSGHVTEDAVVAGSHWLETSGSLMVVDPDRGESQFTPHLAADALVGAYGTLTIDAAGTWHYRADNEQPAIQRLAEGGSAVDYFTVTSADGTAQQISVTLHGVNDAPVISQVSVVAGGVQEDAPRTSVIGQLLASDVDTGAHLTWSLTAGDGTYGSLALDAATGVWTYMLDNSRAATQGLLGGQQAHETFLVTVSDGLGGTAQQQVNVVVTGSNDLPVISGSSAGAVREDAPVHTVGGTLSAVDADSGDTLRWSVVNADGAYGHFSVDPHTGQWSYALDNARAATNALPEGARVEEIFVVQATDSSGQPVSQRVTIDITGSNDLPVLGGSHQAALVEDATKHQATGSLTHSDPDKGDTFHWSAVGSNQGQYGDFSFDLNTGKWSYTLDNARPATDALGKGQQVQEVFHLAGTDSSGTPVFQDVVVRITGSNDLPVISGTTQGTVTEDAPTHTAAGTLTHHDPDNGDSFSWALVNGHGTYGTLNFDTATGQWLYTLDNSRAETQALGEGEQQVEQFTVRGQDASGTPVLQVIAVQVHGSNDNPVIAGVHQGSVVEDVAMIASGALSFSDVDNGDTLGGWQVRAPQGSYGTLAIDEHGNWTYHLDAALSQPIRAGDTVQDSFTVRVSDNHGGFADQQVTLLITGTNDAPAIDPRSPALTGQVTEDKAGATTTQGTIPSGDPDIGDSHRWQITGGTRSGSIEGSYGTLSLDQNGHWVYTLDHARADSLAEGQTVTERFPISVTDAAGERSSAYVQVQVHGANDGPHIGGASTGVVTEDVATSASGRLLSGDVDRLDTAHWQVLGDSHGQFGSLTVDSSGTWHYQLDNASSRVQTLGDNDSASEVFRVQVSDPHGAVDIREVTVRVLGHNDVPFITGVDAGKVIEDTVLKVSGQLLAHDTDNNDQPAFQPAHYAGTYGQFVMVPDGHWSYELFAGPQATVQALSEGETATESFTVAAVDQHGGITYRPVTVTVHGGNDAPVISGVSTGVAIAALSETASGRLIGTDMDRADTTTWQLLDGHGQYGTLSLDSLGRWTYVLEPTDADTRALQAGDQVTDTFRVQLLDDKGGTAEQVVTVTVVGTDVPPTNPGTPGAGGGGGGGGGAPVATLPAVSVATTEDVSTVRTGLLQGALPSGPITWQVVPANGAFGQLSLGANGQWLYTLNNDAPQVQGLNEGQTVQERFAVHGVDAAGNQVQTQFNVTINGSNDIPRIVGVDTGSAVEDKQPQAHGSLTVLDPDMGDVASWNVQQPQGALGVFSVDANGDWQYQLDNAEAQRLNAGDSLIERFQVVAEDGHGGRETHEVVVTVHGTADAPIIPSITQGTAKPGASETLSGQVLAHDADAGDSQVFALVSQPHGQFGTLSLDANGNWQYQLDPASANDALRALAEGEQAVDSFTVQVRDSTGNISQQQIQLQISGSNDAPSISGASTGAVFDPVTLQTSGQLIVSDPDTGDAAVIAAQSVDGAHGHFDMDDSGHWTYRLDSQDSAVRALNEGEQLTETFHVRATDQHGAQVGRDVVITVHGSNDIPLVTGDTQGSTEEDGKVRAQGVLSVSDPDTGDHTEWVNMNTASAYGHFQMDANGAWVYALNNDAPQTQALKEGQVITETFTAHGSDSHGAQVTQVISIEVHGQNDAAVITGQRTGDISEDENVLAGHLVVSGQVHVSDVDSGEGLITAQTLTGSYGALTLRSDGTWRYSADNSQHDIQQLGAGQTLVEHINLTTADGTPYQISITIHGSDDAPVLSAISAQTADEDGPLVTGQLQASDIDQGDTLAYSTTATVAGFTLNADGSYSFDPADPAWQYLAEGVQHRLDIPLTVTDSGGASATQHLLITLTGTNDLPVLSVHAPAPVHDGSQPISGHVTGTDVDIGDVLTFTTSAQVAGFTLDSDGTWHFNPSHADYLSLPEGATLRLAIPLTVTDNHGGSDTQTLLITLTGTNQGASITGTDTATVSEDQGSANGLLQTDGQLAIADPDSHEAIFVAQALSGAYGTFNVDASGAWHYSADNSQPAIQTLGAGESLSEQFVVHSADGTAHSVTVTLTGSNDVPVMSALTQRAADENGGLISGQAQASDVDGHAVLTFSTAAAIAGFTLDADGHYTFDPADPAYQHLAAGETQVLSIDLTVTDDQGATATQPLLITLTGSNNGAVVSGIDHGDLVANQVEPGGFLLETGGQLDVDDPDTGQAQFIAHDAIGGLYGALSIDASGAWHYTADNDQQVIQQLAPGESLTDSFTVATADGTEHPIVVTLTGDGASAAPLPAPEPQQTEVADTPEPAQPAAADDTQASAATESTDAALSHTQEQAMSPVDHYLQFAQMETAPEDGQEPEDASESSPADDAAQQSTPLDGYLQHAGIDPANFSPPDPAHLGSPPPDDAPFSNQDTSVGEQFTPEEPGIAPEGEAIAHQEQNAQ
ncbi:VCBS domain-containing protein [Pseudomonas turukhanskensis]|uniref:Cadherin domain-containing protein n=1 Tax=Pseudomonas turukhanskensis TaxID=1806536 RepID=A0A9W6NHM5_9PSED|nr:VCBS domain-containing protein [Pseudomonas turukhanskensis]GLK91047.1 hypothetical protein GCM10017655_41110 [Pseudomonas turukhanskensis]